MQNSFEFLELRITGNSSYECLLSPNLYIVREIPGNEYLHNKNLQELYSKHKDKILFENIKICNCPLILDSDKYPIMVQKNKSLAYLKEKFNCDMI